MNKMKLLNILFIFCIVGCTSVSDNSSQRQISVGLNESIIVVKRKFMPIGLAAKFNVIVNNKNVGSVINGREIEFVIPNGTHTIQIKATGAFKSSNLITFSANSEEIVFVTQYTSSGSFTGETSIDKIEGGSIVHTANTTNVLQSTEESSILDRAIALASNDILSKLSFGQKISMFNTSQNEIDISEYAIEEITVVLVNTSQFIVLERENLDVINAEHSFQMSGEVNDDDFISIGQKYGAQIVVTCSISGSGGLRRLRIKTIDVQTGQILSFTSYSI